MDNTLFQTTVSVFTSIFDPAANGVIGAGLSAVGRPFSILLVIYVIVTGMMCMRGEVSGAIAVRRVLRAGFVSMLMTGTYFNPYIRDLFVTTIPSWISSALTNSSTTNLPQQCDLIRSAMGHFAATIYQNTSIVDTDVRMETMACTFVGTCFLAVLVLISTVTHAFMVLTVCTAPFVLAAYLFDATKGVVEGWIGKAVGLSILALLVSVTAQIVVAADRTMVLNIANSISDGLYEQVSNLSSMVVFFFMMSLILAGLPSVAYSIGRGVASSTGAAEAFALPGRALRAVRQSSLN